MRKYPLSLIVTGKQMIKHTIQWTSERPYGNNTNNNNVLKANARHFYCFVQIELLHWFKTKPKKKKICLFLLFFSFSFIIIEGPLLPFDGLICKRTNLFIYCVYELCATAATVVSVAAAAAFAALSRRK